MHIDVGPQVSVWSQQRSLFFSGQSAAGTVVSLTQEWFVNSIFKVSRRSTVSGSNSCFNRTKGKDSLKQSFSSGTAFSGT